MIRVFGDVKFVSNIFHEPLTLWKVSKDSEMVMHFFALKVAETVWNDPKSEETGGLL